MADAASGQVSRQAAERYEEYFVPALFGEWPSRLLERAGVGPGDRVVDVACGTGVLARAASRLVGPTGSVVGVDPNGGMLDVAARRAPDVTWMRGVAEELPLESDSADQVCCQFGLMFFTDRAAAIREMARVTRPGGRVVVATWADVAASPGYDAMVGLLRRIAGDVPADALLAPFSIGNPVELHALMAPALPGVRVERYVGRARFPSILDWLETDIRAWTLENLITDEAMAELRATAPKELAAFCQPDGAVEFAAPALLGVATLPT